MYNFPCIFDYASDTFPVLVVLLVVPAHLAVKTCLYLPRREAVAALPVWSVMLLN